MFRPMLSPRESPGTYKHYFERLRYPLLCSAKYDGIRCIVKGNEAVSRTLKQLPSIQVQDEFTHYNHTDGEIIVGNPTDFGVYNRTQSYVMSEDKFIDDLHYYVFDYCHPDWLQRPFFERHEKAQEIIKDAAENYHLVPHELVYDETELLAFEAKCLELGFEGIMMRDPLGPYKCNRGTFTEGWIYKLKRFEDAEGILVDVLEGKTNNNTKEVDERGYAKRSFVMDNLADSGMSGTLIVEWQSQFLDVAPGNLTHAERKHILRNKDKYLGQLLKFKFMRHGMKDKPRFIRAVGFRNRIDI